MSKDLRTEAVKKDPRKTPLRSPYGDSRRTLELKNEDPTMHYRWGLIDDPERPGRNLELEEFGFTLVPGSNRVVTSSKAKRTDSMIFTSAGRGGGKLALFYMPKETKQYHDTKRDEMNSKLISNRSSQGIKGSESLNVIVNTKEGI